MVRRPSPDELETNEDYQYNIPRMIIEGKISQNVLWDLMREATINSPVIDAGIRYFVERNLIEEVFERLLRVVWDGAHYIYLRSLLENEAEFFSNRTFQIILDCVRKGSQNPMCGIRIYEFMTPQQRREIAEATANQIRHPDALEHKMFIALFS